MGRPLRLIEPNVLYFITNRTQQARFLLRPSAEVNNDVGAALGRSAQANGVKLYAYVVTSNHVHLIVSGSRDSIPAFMRDFKSWSAKKVSFRIKWSGAFWERRYSCEPILDDDALRGRYSYILQHGMKEALVDRPEDWPGLHCVEHLRTGAARTFLWFDASEFGVAERRGKKPKREQFMQVVVLELTPPPFATDDAAARRECASMIESAIAQATEARAGRPSLGVAHILAQDPYDRPSSIKRSPRPLCHASSLSVRREYRAKYRAFVRAFREAVGAWREGRQVLFPKFSFSPGGLVAAVA